MTSLYVYHDRGVVHLECGCGGGVTILSPAETTQLIADLLDAKRAQQAYLAQHANNEPAPETKREGSASTWPAPTKHHYELCVIEHICDTCKYDSVEPEPEYCLGCTNNNCRWEPAPRNDEIRGAE